MEGRRYDEIAAWYDETCRPPLTTAETDALEGREYPYMVGLRCRR
jgi:hypothetical protein